jgi:hypothetical protein
MTNLGALSEYVKGAKVRQIKKYLNPYLGYNDMVKKIYHATVPLIFEWSHPRSSLVVG